MASQLRRLGRQGFSLVEMLIVVVVIGLLTLWTVPRAGVILDHTAVRSARTALANEFILARNAARNQNKVSVLRLSGNLMWIEMNATNGTTAKDTLRGIGGSRWLRFDSTYAVTVTGGQDSLKIDPRGIFSSAAGSAIVYTLTRRGWRDSVVINSYGRVTR